MNRTKNSARNILYGFINRIISLVLIFLSRKLFIYYIGVEYLGINSLFSNILSILSMADLGMGVAMSYSFYTPLAEGNTKKLAALITFYKRVYNIIAVSVLVIGLLLLPFLDRIVKVDSVIPYLNVYYIIALLQTVVSYLFVYKTTIIIADQKNYIINKIYTAVDFVITVLQIIIIVLFKNYILYALLQLFSVIAKNVWCSRKADRLYPYINKKINIESEEKRAIYRNMGSIFLYKLSGTFMNSIDSICISSICGTVVLGFYVNYLTITNQIEAIVSIVFSAFTASIGNLITDKNSEKSYKVFSTLQLASEYVSALCFLGLLFLTQDFVVMWIGEEYLLDMQTIFFIAANLYLGISFRPLWSYREATGLYVKTKYIMFVAAVLNLILSIVLGLYMGVAGVVFASILCRIATYFWYEPNILFKEYFNKSSNSFFLRYFRNIILIFVVYLELRFILPFISCQKLIMSWIFKGFTIVLIVSTNYWIAFRNTKEYIMIKNRIIYLLGRKKT